MIFWMFLVLLFWKDVLMYFNIVFKLGKSSYGNSSHDIFFGSTFWEMAFLLFKLFLILKNFRG